MSKKFPINPAHPERVCWGCDLFCAAKDMPLKTDAILAFMRLNGLSVKCRHHTTEHACRLFHDSSVDQAATSK